MKKVYTLAYTLYLYRYSVFFADAQKFIEAVHFAINYFY